MHPHSIIAAVACVTLAAMGGYRMGEGRKDGESMLVLGTLGIIAMVLTTELVLR